MKPTEVIKRTFCSQTDPPRDTDQHSRHTSYFPFLALPRFNSGCYLPPKKQIDAQDTRASAPVAYQVILEPGIGQFREFEPRRVHTRINSLGLFLVDKLTCGKRESVG